MIKVKINDVWHTGSVKVKQEDIWHPVKKIYVKQNDQWVEV